MDKRKGNSPRGRASRDIRVGFSALLGGVSLAALAIGSQAVADEATDALTMVPAQTAQSSQSVPTQVPPVPVVSTPLTPDQVLQQDGTAAQGYAAKLTAGNGPLPQQPLMDTNYPISVVSQQLMQNLQIYSPTDLARIDPFLQLYVPASNSDQAAFTIRGFGTSSFGGGTSSSIAQTVDGFRLPNVADQDLEDKERVEVFTGVTSYIDGVNAPGGTISFIQKRPTVDRLDDVTVGDYGGGSGFIHGDFGGLMPGNENIGYRLNVVEQGGPTAVDQQSINRQLISGALDFHLADNMLLETDLLYRHNQIDSNDTLFLLGTANNYPTAPDATKDWGEPWTYDTSWTYQGDAKFTWNINDFITSRTGILGNTRKSNFLGAIDFINSDNTYDQSINLTNDETTRTISAYQYEDFKFSTWSLRHTLTVGGNGYEQSTYLPRYFFSTEFTPYFSSLGSLTTGPVYAPVPEIVPPGSDFQTGLSARAVNANIVLGDDIKVLDNLDLLLGGNHTNIVQKGWQPLPTGDRQTADYQKSATTPALSVIYKPQPWISTYVSYLEGLEEGATAPLTADITNRGEVFAPSISKDYELGTKIQLDQAFLTLNLFDVTRAYDFLQPNGGGTFTYMQSGTDDHRGVEVGVTGKVTDDLTLFGGATYFDAKVRNSSIDNGDEPFDVSNKVAKLYAEYAIRAVPGLSVNGGVQYAGDFFGDAANTEQVPSSVVGDLGARYEAVIYGTPSTFRFNVTNIANTNYWTASGYLGEPRTFTFSAEFKF